jgi:hypothetical protein
VSRQRAARARGKDFIEEAPASGAASRGLRTGTTPARGARAL